MSKDRKTEKTKLENFSFKKYAWNQFKKNKPAKFSLYLLILIVIIALFAPYIANERPLYAKYKGKSIYPAFADETQRDSIFNEKGEFESILQYDITDWRTLKYEKVRKSRGPKYGQLQVLQSSWKTAWFHAFGLGFAAAESMDSHVRIIL